MCRDPGLYLLRTPLTHSHIFPIGLTLQHCASSTLISSHHTIFFSIDMQCRRQTPRAVFAVYDNEQRKGKIWKSVITAACCLVKLNGTFGFFELILKGEDRNSHSTGYYISGPSLSGVYQRKCSIKGIVSEIRTFQTLKGLWLYVLAHLDPLKWNISHISQVISSFISVLSLLSPFL